MIPVIFWQVLLFLLSLHAYLSYSLVSQDALAFIHVPAERKKESYSLAPLSVLCDQMERLVAILIFCRLLFAIPVLLLAHRWTFPTGTLPVILVVTSLALLLYLLPGWLLLRRSMPIARATVQAVSYLLYPVFWILARLPSPQVEKVVLEEEKRRRTNGEPEEEESEEFKVDILKAVSVIGETTVREVMTPRVDMVCIPATSSLAELLQLFREHKFSRLPVYREKIDNVIGIVSVMDLVSSMPNSDLSSPVSSILHPAVFVPETKKVFNLLLEFRESHAQMAIVIDEYGGTSGLVTLEDLLEEIVGEIEDEYDEARFESFREKDGAYVVTGKFPIERLEEIFQMNIAAEDFETVSGLIFSILGRIPVVGEIIQYKNLSLEVLEADKRRIHRLRIRQLPKKEDAETVL